MVFEAAGFGALRWNFPTRQESHGKRGGVKHRPKSAGGRGRARPVSSLPGLGRCGRLLRCRFPAASGRLERLSRPGRTIGRVEQPKRSERLLAGRARRSHAAHGVHKKTVRSIYQVLIYESHGLNGSSRVERGRVLDGR